ncbi:MAG: DUF2769 domain-containing protein [Candidatus Paceibacterota bacterium]
MKPQDCQENYEICACPACPLYNECNDYEKERLFCSRGKAQCSMDVKKDCICESCGVYLENHLEGRYFCAKGE